MNFQMIIDMGLDCFWRITWQASILIGLILLVQWLLRDKLSARWRFAFWWLILLRLMLPVIPESAWSIFNVAGANLSEKAANELIAKPVPSFPVTHNIPANTMANEFTDLDTMNAFQENVRSPILLNPTINEPVLSWHQSKWFRLTLAGTWILGALLYGGWILFGSLWFKRHLAQKQPVDNPRILDVLEECRQIMGLRKPLVVIETPEVDCPALFGLFRSKILVPASFTSMYTVKEWRHILLHEFAHVRRYDVLLNCLMAILQALHWFNPLVWFAFHRIKADRELACDALVLSHLTEPEQKSYGQTLIKILESLSKPKSIPALVGILEIKSLLKQRITMITRYHHSSQQATLAVALWIALGFACLTDAQTQKSINNISPMREGEKLMNSREYAENSSENPTNQQPAYIIEIQPDSSFLLNGKNNTFDQIQRAFAEAKKLNPDICIEFRCHPSTPFEVLSKLMECAKNYGITRVTIKSHPKWQSNLSDAQVQPTNTSFSQLINRTFDLDPQAIQNSPEIRALVNLDPISVKVEDGKSGGLAREISDIGLPDKKVFMGSGAGISPPLINTNTNWINAVRQYLMRETGVDFLESTNNKPIRPMYYSDGKGILFVRATQDELNRIEPVIKALNKKYGRGELTRRLFKFAPNIILKNPEFVSLNTLMPHTTENSIRLFLGEKTGINFGGVFLKNPPSRNYHSNDKTPLTVLPTQRDLQKVEQSLSDLIKVNSNAIPTHITPIRRMFYNDRTGAIIVDSTQDEQQKLEQALKALNKEYDSTTDVLVQVPSQNDFFLFDYNANTGLPRFIKNDSLQTLAKSNQISSNAITNSLLNRTFRVDPNIFLTKFQLTGISNNMETMVVYSSGGMAGMMGGSQTGATLLTLSSDYQDIVRTVFTEATGINFGGNFGGNSTNNAIRPMFFNERTGTLFVRATQEELSQVEKLISTFNSSPAQICVDVRLIEIEQNETKALGFDWHLGQVQMDTTSAANPIGVAAISSNSVSLTNPSGVFPGPGATAISGISSGVRSNPSGVFPELVELLYAYHSDNSANPSGVFPGPGTTTTTGILTEAQFRVVERALQQREGCRVIAAPKVTTLSGRQMQLKTENLFSIDILPILSSDEYTIKMDIKLDWNEKLASNSNTNLQKIVQCSSTVNVRDGQTVVLGGFVTEETVKDKKIFKNRMVFLTPTIIDPAGNRVHHGDDPANPKK